MQMAGLLARWFRFQPSEIDALEIDELVEWVELAKTQIKAENEANKG
ncbi:MAG: GpE family phage tail protein [Methylotenera sp.]|nr:GpE family phage tail protein [Methylotenera sp.]